MKKLIIKNILLGLLALVMMGAGCQVGIDNVAVDTDDRDTPPSVHIISGDEWNRLDEQYNWVYARVECQDGERYHDTIVGMYIQKGNEILVASDYEDAPEHGTSVYYYPEKDCTIN